MSISSFIDYVETDSPVLRPAVVVHRGKRAVAVPLELAYLFTGHNAEHDREAMARAINYCAVLYDDHVTKADTIRILDEISKQMNSVVFAPPAPKELEFNAQKFAEDHGLKVTMNGEEVLNAAN